MKKIVLLVLLILGGYNHAYTQERWISNIELDLVFPNIFYEQNYFKLGGANPLLGLPSNDEIPRSLTVKSLGISIGITL